MIPRYSRPEMNKHWSDQHRFDVWLRIELLACEAQAELGIVPEADLLEIKEKAGFDIANIEQIEKETHHDVIAFLTDVGEHIGPASRFVHYGMTSSDVVDTALSVLMTEALDMIDDELEKTLKVLRDKAVQYKDAVMIGRTHGIHAEPTTFGLKLALWYFEMTRNRKRLHSARKTIAVGKISGAVGTYSNIDPFVEQYVCERMGLRPDPVSTQIIQRDRHAEYMAMLGILASSTDKIATEIRHLQRTEVLEVAEPFGVGQKGSSAMPHKRNPIVCERLSGLARLVRSHVQAALENVTLWHERDISHSSVERIIVPDATIAVDYMLAKLNWILEGMEVYPDRMQENLDLTKGLIFSQRVLLALVEKGASREVAYKIVQRNAMDSWQNRQPLMELLKGDPEATNILTSEEIEACFDLDYYMRNIGEIFERLNVAE